MIAVATLHFRLTKDLRIVQRLYDVVTMLSGTSERVSRIVREWHPKKEYRSEAGYRDELLTFIRKELKKGTMWGPPERHRIRKESGRHLADIGIDEKIGIELKRNLNSQSSLDRLIGQIRRFMRSYGYIIVVLCGEVNEGILDELKIEFKEYLPSTVWRPETVIEETVIEIVGKGRRKEKKGPKGWVDLFEEI